MEQMQPVTVRIKFPILAFWAHSSWNIFNRCNFATAPSKFRFEPPLEFCVHSLWKTRNRCDPLSCNFSSAAAASLWLLHVSAEFSLPLSFRAGPVVVNNAFVRRRLYYTGTASSPAGDKAERAFELKLQWKQSCVFLQLCPWYISQQGALLNHPHLLQQQQTRATRMRRRRRAAATRMIIR